MLANRRRHAVTETPRVQTALDELRRGERGARHGLGARVSVEARAINAQRQLARAGHHRMPPVDVIMAALADTHGVGVLHYDADFDVLRAKTDLRFASVWLAARGTL